MRFSKVLWFSGWLEAWPRQEVLEYFNDTVDDAIGEAELERENENWVKIIKWDRLKI